MVTNDELLDLIQSTGVKVIENDRALLDLGEALTSRVLALTDKVNELDRIVKILHREMNRVLDYEDKDVN